MNTYLGMRLIMSGIVFVSFFVIVNVGNFISKVFNKNAE